MKIMCYTYLSFIRSFGNDHSTFVNENNLLHMFNHFDMTSNYGTDFMPNSLLHDCLSIQVMASIFDTSPLCVPLLGWFNDEHCNIILMNKSFTYICKLSCNKFQWFVSCDNSMPLYCTRYADYPPIYVSYVTQH